MPSQTSDDRDRTVAYCRGRWVPAAELFAWLELTLRLTPGQGRNDLIALVRSGRLERRRLGKEHPGQGNLIPYEYRAKDGFLRSFGTEPREVAP